MSGFVYRPMDDRSEGGEIDDGVLILPFLVECYYYNGCDINCIDDVSSPALIQILPHDSQRMAEDGNFISKCAMKVNFRPTDFDETMDLTNNPWRIPWTLDIDLTSSTVYDVATWSHSAKETPKDLQCINGVVAATIYSYLLTASVPSETTVTVRVHGVPSARTFGRGFDGDYHWDDENSRLTSGTLNNYSLLPSKRGFYCTYASDSKH